MSYSKQHEEHLLAMIRPLMTRQYEALAILTTLEFILPLMRLTAAYGSKSIPANLRKSAVGVRRSLNEVLKSDYKLDIYSECIIEEIEELQSIRQKMDTLNEKDSAVLRSYLRTNPPPSDLGTENPELQSIISPYL